MQRRIFTDTGGTLNNYENGQYLVRTITPTTPGIGAVVTFTEFDLELDFDFLFVYNGATTDAPLIGMFTGSEIPGPFTSTAPDGSLTFEFISDQFLTGTGWVAIVTCATLGTSNRIVPGFTFYPNPSSGLVNMSANEEINNIEVFNIVGQLILTRKNNSNEASVDLAAFADGVYFFRITSDTAEMNFRISKQ